MRMFLHMFCVFEYSWCYLQINDTTSNTVKYLKVLTTDVVSSPVPPYNFFFICEKQGRYKKCINCVLALISVLSSFDVNFFLMYLISLL